MCEINRSGKPLPGLEPLATYVFRWAGVAKGVESALSKIDPPPWSYEFFDSGLHHLIPLPRKLER